MAALYSPPSQCYDIAVASGLAATTAVACPVCPGAGQRPSPGAAPSGAGRRPAPLAPGARLGQYRIVAQLGRGAMSTVYKAYQPALSRCVAINVLPSSLADHPSYVERSRVRPSPSPRCATPTS